MNPKIKSPSMFLHRLKLEFSENVRLLIAIWVVFGIIVWSFYQWWFHPLTEQESSQGAISGMGVIVLGILMLLFVATLIKRDDLKHPQEFWVTRPIRSLTLFGTKLVFAWLVIALPCAVVMTMIGMIAGVGLSAVWYGLEMMLWVSLMTNLLALSSMANPGTRTLYGFLCFIGGVILTCILINNAPLDRLLNSYGVSDRQMSWNIFIMLIALNIWFGWKCWRLIRHKHNNERALAIGALGVLTVVVIAFAPIPRSLPGAVLDKSTTTLPAVTIGLSQLNNCSVGEKYGAKFASFLIFLNANDSIRENQFQFGDADLNVTGQDNAMLEVKAEQISFQPHENQSWRTSLVLSFSIFDRKPNTKEGTSSHGIDSRTNKIIAGLPLRKVRIHGIVTLNQLEYREIVSGPIDQPFEHSDGGIICAYNPESSPNAYNTAWKIFSPPSALSEASHRWERTRFRLEDKNSSGFSSYQLTGGSMGGGTFIGSYQMQNIRIRDTDIELDYNWRQLKESGYNKSVQEWKKDVQLVFEVVDRETPLIIPVDVEVEVPDPSKVRELLQNGTL